MKPLCVLSEEDEAELFLKPKNKNRFGFLVGCNESEYVLYQYLSPIEIGVNRNVSRDFFEHVITLSLDEYTQEIGRTSDLNEMKKCLRTLANRYTESVVYTVPLSLDTYTESDELENIGKQVYSINGDKKCDVTADEKQAAESIRKYIKNFAKRKKEKTYALVYIISQTRQTTAKIFAAQSCVCTSGEPENAPKRKGVSASKIQCYGTSVFCSEL